ncbi:hypothetical protein B0H13DRAFT_2281936 [Mycena leptocephala]|nr:hypothetical protein B0H13DRAFT_2281936 [Mycena leptocephala]
MPKTKKSKQSRKEARMQAAVKRELARDTMAAWPLLADFGEGDTCSHTRSFKTPEVGNYVAARRHGRGVDVAGCVVEFLSLDPFSFISYQIPLLGASRLQGTCQTNTTSLMLHRHPIPRDRWFVEYVAAPFVNTRQRLFAHISTRMLSAPTGDDSRTNHLLYPSTRPIPVCRSRVYRALKVNCRSRNIVETAGTISHSTISLVFA